MADIQRQERPRWVRWIVRRRATRPAALLTIVCLAILAGFNIVVAASMESGSNSILGDLAVPVALTGASLCGGCGAGLQCAGSIGTISGIEFERLIV
jgi:hypothetical protein